MTIGLVLIAILIILYFTGRKSVHHEILINASPNEVWAVLANTEKYTDWNPVMLLKVGKIQEGQQVVYQFTQAADKQYDISTSVKKVTAGKLLNQGGGMTGILAFDHRYILEPSDTGTKVTIHEDYRGIGVNFWNPTPVEKAYERLNIALKNRVESLSKE